MSSESSIYKQYIPQDIGESKVREQYSLEVSRIAKYVPPSDMFRFFSSTPSETGGVVIFPYVRIDSCVLTARDSVYMLTQFPQILTEKDKYFKIYERNCRCAFKALVWTEIGFQGLENLAVSPASVNWTSAVGHIVTPQERAESIMTDGKQMYEECLSDFTRFHINHEVPIDYFRQYGVSHLLDRFR